MLQEKLNPPRSILTQPIQTLTLETSSPDPLFPQDKTSPLALETVVVVLSTYRRREVLKQLAFTAETEVKLRTLPELIAAGEYNCSCPGLTSQQRKRVYNSLYQRYFGKLANAGAIQYTDNVIALGLTSHHLMNPYSGAMKTM
jgi:hypothetical protein